MRSIGTASFFALCLAIAGCNNGTTTATDAGGGGADTGNGGTDAGTPTTDTGTPAEDTGTPAEDTGMAADTGLLLDANIPLDCTGFHGCTAATATDMTGMSTVAIATTATFTYDPPCIRISTGTMVTIAAAAIHPLTDATCSPADSPIPAGATTAQTLTFDHAGQYGYYCSVHGSDLGVGMAGLIIVE